MTFFAFHNPVLATPFFNGLTAPGGKTIPTGFGPEIWMGIGFLFFLILSSLAVVYRYRKRNQAHLVEFIRTLGENRNRNSQAFQAHQTVRKHERLLCLASRGTRMPKADGRPESGNKRSAVVATNRIVTKNPKKLIHRLEVFGSLLESQFSRKAPEPVWEEKPEIPPTPEQVLETWLEFTKTQPAASDNPILAGPYKGKQDTAEGSLDLLDSFLSGGK